MGNRMSFRLEKFKLDEPKIQTPWVRLTDNNESNDNYFTVIIGNNGTGKSRFLRGIASEFRRKGKDRYDLFSQNDSGNEPSKLIAITTSLSDKFPSAYNVSRHDKMSSLEDYYCYLGPRGRVGGSSSRALMDRAISYLMAKSNNRDFYHQYNEIFNYLKYEPIIKLEYRLSIPKEFNELVGELSGAELKSFIRKKSELRNGIRHGTYNKFLEFDDEYWSELANAYSYAIESNDLGGGRNFSFVINFSLENIGRKEQIISSSEVERYELFDALRKLDLMKNMRVKLYKKGGGEFDYTDASSGEASILSTLIGLVPNLEDNSLVLIDEPEISLHPSWQYRYIELIDKLLQSVKGCHVIVATHSHFLISDLPNGRSNIVHFKSSKGNRIDVDYYDENTNGMSAEDILLNIFDMPSTRNYYLSAIVSELLQLLADGQKHTHRYHDLCLKVKKILPNLKPVDPLYDVISKITKLGGSNDR